MKYRKALLLLISFLSYTLIIGWKVIFLVALAVCILVTNRVMRMNTRKWITGCVITFTVFGFYVFRNGQDSTMLIGYSVFAFTGISFVIDQYRYKMPYNTCDTLLFLFFFPKMLAGPIVRASEFIPQLSQRWEFKSKDVYQGIKLLIFGMFVKFFISDGWLATEGESQGIDFILLSLVWGIRFYFDFYAYSVIAVGIGLMLGISLPLNFNRPYHAISFRDFWKRWNITLSSWLRDYVYIPLGGSRCSQWRSSLNVIITFLISGLWHGVAFPFLLWGMFHGFLVIVERFFKNRKKNVQSNFHMGYTSYNILVATITMLLWQLFKCSNITDVCMLFCDTTTSGDLTLSTIFIDIIAVSSLCLIDSKWMYNVIYEMSDSTKGIITEVTVVSIMLMVLLLCPFQYTFDFFYFKF